VLNLPRYLAEFNNSLKPLIQSHRFMMRQNFTARVAEDRTRQDQTDAKMTLMV